LQSYIPPSDLDDRLEMSWGFIDKRIDGTTSRHIVLYKFDENLIDLFWNTTENGHEKLIEYGTKYSTLYPKFLKEFLDFKHIKNK